eukprot:SAG31_NODE_2271_length_6040_cov_3.379397_4_plen_433_part_00
MPIHKITRMRDGDSIISTNASGVSKAAEYFGEVTLAFRWHLKLGWAQHVDTRAHSFTFKTKKYMSHNNRGVFIEDCYLVEPFLLQSASKTSKFVPLTADHLDNLVQYLRSTKTDGTTRTFGLKSLSQIPDNACFVPHSVHVDLVSDLLCVTFQTCPPRSTMPKTIFERYYLSVPTLGQMERKCGKWVPNLRPKIVVYWRSRLENRVVMARLQVCQLLIAVRNSNHIHAVLASPKLLEERRGFTEVEHVTRELDRTRPSDLTFLSRALQQQNIGKPRQFLRDVDPVVAKAYRFSRQPIHLLSNMEYHNVKMILLLRRSQHLTHAEPGGPLYQCRVKEWHRGQCRSIPLCEAKNCKDSQQVATAIKGKMLASLGLLLANIACRREESCKGDGVRSSTRFTLYKRDTWSSLQADACFEATYHHESGHSHKKMKVM